MAAVRRDPPAEVVLVRFWPLAISRQIKTVDQRSGDVRDVVVRKGRRKLIFSTDIFKYDIGYSRFHALHYIEQTEAALFSAFAGRIPVECPQPEDWMAIKVVDEEIFTAKTAIELSERLEPLIVGVEDRLDSAYEAIERGQSQ